MDLTGFLLAPRVRLILTEVVLPNLGPPAHRAEDSARNNSIETIRTPEKLLYPDLR